MCYYSLLANDPRQQSGALPRSKQSGGVQSGGVQGGIHSGGLQSEACDLGGRVHGALQELNPRTLNLLPQTCIAYIAYNLKTCTAAYGLGAYNLGACNMGACCPGAYNMSIRGCWI